MSDAINLQDAILKEVRREKVPVTLFLMNGFQLRGVCTVWRGMERNTGRDPERNCAQQGLYS